MDYGIKDAMNMGAAMAPAACELIVNHLSDFGRKASYYDRIVTGDLGSVGQKILIDLCRQKRRGHKQKSRGLWHEDV